MIAFVRSIFGRSYWSLRVRFWSWRENRALARLQNRRVVLIADRPLSWQSTPNSLSPGDTTFIAEMAEHLRLQPLIFGDGLNFIRAIGGEATVDEDSLSCETAKQSLEEQAAKLIAEYDAHFLASIRIKSPGQSLSI